MIIVHTISQGTLDAVLGVAVIVFGTVYIVTGMLDVIRARRLARARAQYWR